MDLCVHLGKPAFIYFISSLYLYFGFSNKHFSFIFHSLVAGQVASRHMHISDESVDTLTSPSIVARVFETSLISITEGEL